MFENNELSIHRECGKGIDESELTTSYKTLSDSEILKTANSLLDRFDDAFKELAK